jgi:hypothetical protein
MRTAQVFLSQYDFSNDTRLAKELWAWLRAEILPKLGRQNG